MGFRGKSIRRKIVALLLVPLLFLTAIWAFATVITWQEARQLVGINDVLNKVGLPVQNNVVVLQQERRQTMVYLADPRASGAQKKLKATRAATDRTIDALQRAVDGSDVRDDISTESRRSLDEVLDSFQEIPSLRATVADGSATRSTVLDQYSELITSCHELLDSLAHLDNAEVDKKGRALVGVSVARELFAQEDALLGSALVARHLDRQEIRKVSDLVAQRELLYQVNLPLLPDDQAAPYEQFWRGGETSALRSAEQAVSDSSPGTPRAITSDRWDATADKALDRMLEEGIRTYYHFDDSLGPATSRVITQAVIAGVLGLLAVVFSLFMSVRIGRALVRDLRRLRQDAHESSGVRLPAVMRRLAAGERVDVETEAPQLDYPKDEIGQVGQALNSLQRAAVEAAVKQAELRQGVSEVFVNLARRSQVLLHRQLTLLDTMERRTEDTDELADLFRLDHLTTRMRRHAEGLVILSGAAPSRQWRKPVRLMDVVRAAVAEVEDYERIEVRRLPRMAVTGPAVADITHLIAELLENATVFSPPHTTVQVHGDRVANGFTLEIHDRGLGMAADALLDANLRLAETPEFELSDTDRLGLFVVSRLAQRQNVRVSLQPSPYGGTTAVVFIPDALLTEAQDPEGREEDTGGVRVPAQSAGQSARDNALTFPGGTGGGRPIVLDGPTELEAPVGTDDIAEFPGALLDEDSERGGLFRPRRPVAPLPPEQHQQARDARGEETRPTGQEQPEALRPLPKRTAPKLVSSHGRPVEEPPGEQPPARGRAPEQRGPAASGGGAPQPPAAPRENSIRQAGEAYRSGPPAAEGPVPPAAPLAGPGGLPKRVRQANLAPQLKDGPARRTDRQGAPPAPQQDGTDRDADEVRSRMASLQRGWQRGRDENTADQGATEDTGPRTTPEGDGR
ncbi:sensor-like histidine kinase [Streptomyces albus]|uniref:histidine kinase n=1 Tax=Streptomyces albus (strain ATCC 21838 / DSM 41398 / FERM P-419 / JCM 4703 / NBRC 107858) TaxID=1081613 RepID=A0A0B5F5S3_STRA4|nr:sensor-like histidine kinase [Streptomyces albus]AOU81215.1 sensor-like histidine kinase [Streptomyces albus]AYN36911.1 histidine kinase [Streptomyces albus]